MRCRDAVPVHAPGVGAAGLCLLRLLGVLLVQRGRCGRVLKAASCATAGKGRRRGPWHPPSRPSPLATPLVRGGNLEPMAGREPWSRAACRAKAEPRHRVSGIRCGSCCVDPPPLSRRTGLQPVGADPGPNGADTRIDEPRSLRAGRLGHAASPPGPTASTRSNEACPCSAWTSQSPRRLADWPEREPGPKPGAQHLLRPNAVPARSPGCQAASVSMSARLICLMENQTGSGLLATLRNMGFTADRSSSSDRNGVEASSPSELRMQSA